MADTISIAGIDKAALLAELYNNAKPQGLGFFVADSKKITPAQAQQIANDNGSWRFDYIKGRSVKVNLQDDTAETWLYDRDNGQGAFEHIVNSLREE